MWTLIAGGRLAAAVALIALAMLAPPRATAAGGSYVVNECDGAAGGNPYAASVHAFDTQDTFSNCTQTGSDLALHVDAHNGTVNSGHVAQWYWQAPAGEAIVSVAIWGSLNANNGYHALIYTLGLDAHVNLVANQNGGFWTGYLTSVPPASKLTVELSCGSPTCNDNPQDGAHAYAREVYIRTVDYGDPTLQNVGGSLIGGGWVRGVQSIGAVGLDGQSGVAGVHADANGMPIASKAAGCQVWGPSGNATVFDPCPGSLTLSGSVNTAASPFHDGANSIAVCTADFAGNGTCSAETVHVDNTPPNVTFANAQNPRDPELIKAPVSDAASGLQGRQISYRAAGTSAWEPLPTQLAGDALQARVDSEAVHPGRYEFLAEASDVAGNGASSTYRQDGQPMVLNFPLKKRTHLVAHLKPGPKKTHHHGIAAKQGRKHKKAIHLLDGQGAKVVGRITVARSHPRVGIGGRKIAVIESFAAGSKPTHRALKVRSRRNGRFSARLGPGPIRRVRVGYGGNLRYVGAWKKAGKIVEHGKVLRFHAPIEVRGRKGAVLKFHGKLGMNGVRSSHLGTEVQLEYRQGTAWKTILSRRSKRSGRFSLPFKLRDTYTAGLKVPFRAKVPKAYGWPYTKALSRPRPVRIMAAQ